MTIRKVRLLLLVSICLLCVFNASVAIAQNDTLRFVVCDVETRELLPGVSLFMQAENIRITSDSNGAVLMIVPASIRQMDIELTRVGYRTRRCRLIDIKSTATVSLERDPQFLSEVIVVQNSALPKVQSIQMSTDFVTAKEARLLPSILGESDILKVLQLKPGVKTAGEGISGFYVRGGNSDQNLILLDNVPVYNPNHLLGMFGVFNVDAIRDVTLYKGGYPSYYGGRLSSVVDINSRKGSMDSLFVSGGIGLISTRLSIESPIVKSRSSMIFSARRTYFNYITDELNRRSAGKEKYEPIPSYYFADINFRMDQKVGRRSSLSLSLYQGADNFASRSEKSLATTFVWGNRTASVSFRSHLTIGTLSATLFNSDYRYRFGNEVNSTSVSLNSSINTTGLKVNLASHDGQRLKWNTGAEFSLHNLTIGDYSSVNTLATFSQGERAYGNEGAFYGGATYEFRFPLQVYGGFRLSGYEHIGKIEINPEPRISLKYQLSETTSLKASYTRMYQYLHLASLGAASLPTDLWYPSTSKTKPQFSDQFAVGVASAVFDNRFFVSVEAYYKQMQNQVEFRDGANAFGNPKLEDDFVYGRGKAYGVEYYLEKKQGRTTGWLGYTLSWAERQFDGINKGQPFRPRYDRRHDLSIVLMHKLNSKFHLSGSWVFGSGAWTTVPVGRFMFQDQAGRHTRTITPVYSGRSNYQLSPVHRLDLSVVMKIKSKVGTQDLSIGLYNVYSRRNPLYIQFNEVNDNKGYVLAIQPSVVSLFPVLPSLAYNFKF